MPTDLQRVRQCRAEIMLEQDLWEVVNKHTHKKAAKCEAKIDRLAILCVLGKMTTRVAEELQGYH
jgi:hypothetical protein